MKKPLLTMGSAIALAGLWASPPAWATLAESAPIPDTSAIPPQLDFRGTAIGTLGYGDQAKSTGALGGANVSDSELFFGASQRLFGGAIGSLGFGGLTTDQTSGGLGTVLFLHQASLDFQSQSVEVVLGRTDNRTAHLVDFPTLRGDDLVTFTNPLDPYSNGQNLEEHRYADVAAITFNQGFTWYEDFHAQHLIDSAGTGGTGINSLGARFAYLAPPGMAAFERFPSWGIADEVLPASDRSPTTLNQLVAGGVMNLNQSVTNRWDLRAQDILSLGSGLGAFQTLTDTFQGDSNSLAASLRYRHSPFGSPAAQLALTAAYKRYFRVAGADSVGLALTGIKELGPGFDMVAQVQGEWMNTALAGVSSAGAPFEQTVEMGLAYHFDTALNQYLAPRRSLLNQRHGYLSN